MSFSSDGARELCISVSRVSAYSQKALGLFFFFFFENTGITHRPKSMGLIPRMAVNF